MRIIFGLGVAALLALVIMQRVERTRRPAYEEECAVSECGPDGLPLSAYAG